MLITIFEKYELFLLIMVRMTGVVVFNPLFGRRNVPAMLKAGFALFLAVVTVMPLPVGEHIAAYDSVVGLIAAGVAEFAVGYLMGLVVNMFFAVIPLSGEMIDMQMGMSMSKMYDPGSNVQMPLAAGFFNVALVLMFFFTGAYRDMIYIAVSSVHLFPPGSFSVNPNVGMYLADIFGHVMMISLKFAFPVIASELVTETGIGIIMRAVPQINVFVVGVQLKIIIGIFVLLAMCPFTAWFFGGMLGEMEEFMREAVVIMAN